MTVESSTSEVLITGTADSGKTSTKCMLYNQPSPEKRSSTNLIEQTYSREIMQDLAHFDSKSESCDWIPMDSESDAKYQYEMLSNSIKSVAHMHNITIVASDATHLPTHSNAEDQSLSAVDSCNRPLTVKQCVCRVKKLLLKMLKKKPEITDKCFSNVHFILCRDSGGQSEFHDILPTFVKSTTVVIYVIDLSQTFAEQPLDDYYDKGQRLGDSRTSPYRVEQILKSIIQSVCYNRCHKEKVKVAVVGTHKDVESKEEPLTVKNQEIKCLLHPFVESGEIEVLAHQDYDRGDIIFPINARDQDDDSKKVVSDIRRGIIANLKSHTVSKDIPINWFLLEETLRTLGRQNESDNGIIDREIFEEVAIKNLCMTEKMAYEALKYFHDLNIFLHFSTSRPLSRFIFTKPQFVVTVLSAFVKEARQLRCNGIKDTKYWNLIKQGRFSSNILSLKGSVLATSCRVPSVGFDTGHVIELLQTMFVIAPTNNDEDEYCIPAVLEHNPSVDQYVSKESEYVAPIAIKPQGTGECIPCGYFNAFVCHLLRRPEWKLCRSDMFKNYVCLDIGMTCQIAVINFFHFISVHVYGDCNKAECEVILQDIKAVERILQCPSQHDSTQDDPVTLKKPPRLMFLCLCGTTPEHIAMLTTRATLKLKCSLNQPLEIMKKHTVWFTKDQQLKWEQQEAQIQGMYHHY